MSCDDFLPDISHLIFVAYGGFQHEFRLQYRVDLQQECCFHQQHFEFAFPTQALLLKQAVCRLEISKFNKKAPLSRSS